jgi:Domain of unknown function (DUF3536)
VHFEKHQAGQLTLSVGQLAIRSSVTHFERNFHFAALYMGQHHIIGNLALDMSGKTFEAMRGELKTVFNQSNLGEVIGIMQQYFGTERFTIASLFYDQKRDIITRLTRQNLDKALLALDETYSANYAIMQALEENKLPLPSHWKTIAGQVLRQRLMNFLREGSDLRTLASIEHDTKHWKVAITLDEDFQFLLSARMLSLITGLLQNETSLEQVHLAISILQTLQNLGLKPDLGKAQNYFFLSMRPYRKGLKQYENEEWEKALVKLSSLLKVHIGAPKPVLV